MLYSQTNFSGNKHDKFQLWIAKRIFQTKNQTLTTKAIYNCFTYIKNNNMQTAGIAENKH